MRARVSLRLFAFGFDQQIIICRRNQSKASKAMKPGQINKEKYVVDCVIQSLNQKVGLHLPGDNSHLYVHAKLPHYTHTGRSQGAVSVLETLCQR